MAPGSDYVGVQLLEPDQGSELGSRGDAALREQRLEDTAVCFVAEPIGVLRAFEGVKRVLRVLVRALYLFPALLVVKLALWVAALQGQRQLGTLGDYLTVAFVLLVVVFFATLSLLVLLHVWVGPRSARGRHRVPRFELPTAEARGRSRALAVAPEPRILKDPGGEPLDLERFVLGAKIRVRGELLAIDGSASGGPLLRESWLAEEGRAARLVRARSFAVVATGQPTVGVQIDAAPWLLLEGAGEVEAGAVAVAEHDALDAFVRPSGSSLRELLAAPTRELSAGQQVEVIGVVAERLPSVEGAVVAGQPLRLGAGFGKAPYRGGGGGPALLLISSAAQPVLVCHRPGD